MLYRLGILLVRIAPLRHPVVLSARDGQAVVILFRHQGLDVGHVFRREVGRQFDHHAAGGNVQVQGVVRVQWTPVGRFRSLDHVGQGRLGGQFGGRLDLDRRRVGSQLCKAQYGGHGQAAQWVSIHVFSWSARVAPCRKCIPEWQYFVVKTLHTVILTVACRYGVSLTFT
ncbi:hypothetical protein D3C81_1785120 [compost metagenome]